MATSTATATATSTLTSDQQKQLYNAYYDYIMDLHITELKQDLIKFFLEQKGSKGLVSISYTDIKDMIASVKNKNFSYAWIDKTDALKLKHPGIKQAVTSANPKTDCVLAISLVVGKGHYYVNCTKIKNLE